MPNDEQIEKLLHAVGAYIENNGKSWRGLIPSPWTSATFTDRFKDRSAPEIKFSFANGEVGRSGDYNYEMPLFELRKAIGDKSATISVKMTSDGELLLMASANGKTFKRGGWRCMVSPEAAKPPKPTREQSSWAKDVSNVPPALITGLRSLNKAMRKSHPGTAPHEIPVKFWNIADKNIFFEALRNFPAHFSLLHPAYFKKRAVADLPPGYRAAYKVFGCMMQMECEPLSVAISNVGKDVWREAAAIYRKAGLEKMAELYRRALAEYKADSYENPSKKFTQAEAAIFKAAYTKKNVAALTKYFCQAGLFEL